jgi:hypothetical protein
MAGLVGIFWGIPESDHSWTLLIDSTSLAEAETYGNFLTHPRGHYEVWSHWQRRLTAPLAPQSAYQAVNRLPNLALTQFWCSSDYSAPISLA